MTRDDVKECMSDLGTKKCEGFDRIPVCTLYHSRTPLLDPMTALFDNIYKTKTLPEQWKVAKIIHIFKKGSKNKIENYRPIANLCGTSKIFEKLILKQIHYLESTNKLGNCGVLVGILLLRLYLVTSWTIILNRYLVYCAEFAIAMLT